MSDTQPTPDHTEGTAAALAAAVDARHHAERAAAACRELLAAGWTAPAAAEASTARCYADETRAAATVAWQAAWTLSRRVSPPPAAAEVGDALDHATTADRHATMAAAIAASAMRAAYAAASPPATAADAA